MYLLLISCARAKDLTGFSTFDTSKNPRVHKGGDVHCVWDSHLYQAVDRPLSRGAPPPLHCLYQNSPDASGSFGGSRQGPVNKPCSLSRKTTLFRWYRQGYANFLEVHI